ncbi:MAG: VOC family protein [Myxococcota bacterium]
MPLHWSHAVLYVRDLEAMLDFYTQVLGFEVTDRGALGPDGTGIIFLSQLPQEHHQLAFVARPTGEERESSFDHLAFRVESLGELRELSERLRKDGRVEQIAPITHGNTWSFYFRDLEGNGLEVFCETPWHVQQPQLRGWDPSQSDEELLEWTRGEFQNEAGFGSLEDYRAARERALEKG